MSVLDSFEEWKAFLANQMSKAASFGMDGNNIDKIAYELGDFLAERVDPKNKEQRVLKELWDVSNEEEQRLLAHLMVKLVQRH